MCGLNDFRFLDDNGFYRHVVVVAVAFGGDVFNRIDHIETVRYFAEYGITPTVQAGRGVVEEVVVFGIRPFAKVS